MIYIYKITNTINLKVYIGQTNNYEKRWMHHCKCKKNHPLYNSMRHYGINNFTFEVLCEINDDQYEADQFEIFMIDQYNSVDRRFGYNLSLGGSGCSGGHSEETKCKISEATKKGMTDEVCRKISQANKNRNEETRKKLSIAAKNRSVETRRKMSEANKGKIRSEEHKQNLKSTTKEQDCEIYDLYTNQNYTKRQLSELFNINIRIVERIIIQGNNGHS